MTDSTFRYRKYLLAGTYAAGYATSMILLNQAWYRDYPRASFHVFDDLPEWQQSDKAGHGLSAYLLSRYTYTASAWAGYRDRQSIWHGALFSTLYLGSIEFLDGYSCQWGFSWSDLAANLAGSSLFAIQQSCWHEQRFMIKYSYHSTSYPDLRPDLLGKTWPENLIKDYNGTTCWISGNPSSFFNNPIVPSWLNLAFGYSGSGMLGGRENPISYLGTTLPTEIRYRRFFLSPDLAFSKIKTRSPLLKTLFLLLDAVKVPMPALEFNHPQGFKFHALYF